MGAKVELSGKRFGRLLVIKEMPISSLLIRIRWKCLCDCGNVTTAVSQSLISGAIKSCGCLKNELSKERCTKHGKSGTNTYKIWQGMVGRCCNKNNTNYHRYGGRGISVCERWKVFENFLEDMGERPIKLELDRIDNSKGYSKENCRWATTRQNCRNTRKNTFIEYNGESRCLSEWSEITGIYKSTLMYRLKNMPIEVAFSKPVMQLVQEIK